MSVPYEVLNTAMTGAIQNIKIKAQWNSVSCKMRETNVAFKLYDSSTTRYVTVPAGSSITLSCFNFSSGNSSDYLRVSADSGTMEILGFVREG